MKIQKYTQKLFQKSEKKLIKEILNKYQSII